MKQVVSTIILSLLFSYAIGQSPFNVGIKIGTNSSSLITNVDDFFEESEINHYLAGAFVRVALGRIYLQPEIYFNTKGGFLNSSNYAIENISELFSYQTIDIPLLVGVNLINKPNFNIRLHGGPVLSYVTVDPIITELKDLNIDELKDNYVGIQAGIGVDVWFVTIDARIENSFNIFINNSNYNASNRMYIVSAGIKLF